MKVRQKEDTFDVSLRDVVSEVVKIYTKWESHYKQTFKCSLHHAPYIHEDNTCETCKNIVRMNSLMNIVVENIELIPEAKKLKYLVPIKEVI